jgi:hypothetical protein
MNSQQGVLAWRFASGPVGMHSSPPLIGMYRSLPSCNRPDSISLLGLLTVSTLWCMACGGFFAMSSIEFAEELHQPRHRFSNTGAMTAKATELAFVRNHSCASELGSPRRAGDLSAKRSRELARVRPSRSRCSSSICLSDITCSPHTIRQDISPWKCDIFLPSRERNGDYR